MPATPSPSSSGFHFPSSVPKKEQPNAHPYAIRTSSTAILSRSNSTSSNVSAGSHHYVPSSPSPSATKHAHVKHHRPSRHRYSRSLTSDSPQPLPPPPAGVSPSPTREQFVEEPDVDVDNDTPRRRLQRAETLPSSVGGPVQQLDLPDDPKTWTPSQLSTYLSSTLRAGSANLPGPVAKDIASFVKQRRITGKIFLRLSEDDLIQFGVNQLWRTTLLTASRGLRQTALRGRIWGFGNTPTSPQDEEDQGNLSSSSSNLSSAGFGPSSGGRRSRHSSTASSTSERNRVQDLIESLERSSANSGLDEEGTTSEYLSGRRSNSPSKLSGNYFSSNHHNHVSASPPKPSGGRALPARGTVNNLFSPTQLESDMAVEEKEEDPTIKQVARKNIHGREPRMLPFPPTHGGMMSPAHTGGSAGYQSLSPDHSGSTTFTTTSNSPSIPSDFELGFRPRIYSPHSQAYMVRHNPSSPSNANSGSGSGGRRLLPFPPVTGEALLHHPKPRRLVGTNTGVPGDDEVENVGGGYESETESRLGTIKATSSMSTSDGNTEGYETALEGLQSQNEVERVSSNGSVYQPAEDEEPSMEELLASQGEESASTRLSTSISGVEAWEMELGDTIKRISETGGGGRESLSPEVNAKRGSNGSVAEIGRKAGRNKNGTIGTMGSKKGGGDGLKRGGIMGLFELEPTEEIAPEATVDETSPVELPGPGVPAEEESKQHHHDHLDDLVTRERHIVAREEAVALREEAVSKREEALEVQQSNWRERQASEEEQLSFNLKDVRDQGEELEERERAVRAKEDALGVKEEDVKRKERDVRRREEEVEEQKARVEEKELGLQEAEKRMVEREGEANALLQLPLALLRKCWGTFVLPIVGEERTPTFLSSANAPSASIPVSNHRPVNGELAPSMAAPKRSPTPYRTSTWSIKRDMLVGRLPGTGYIVLMSIGVCVVALRVLGRRAGGVIGSRR